MFFSLYGFCFFALLPIREFYKSAAARGTGLGKPEVKDRKTALCCLYLSSVTGGQRSDSEPSNLINIPFI